MNNLNEQISKYLEYCQYQKRLDEKTLKAYRIDLRQFTEQIPPTDIPNISQAILEDYIVYLHQNYKPKTVKRKIASVKALFHYLEYRKVIEKNPFYKMQIKFREPVILPKIIPLHTLEVFLKTIYKQCNDGKTNYQRRNALRDAAIAELLFSTGIRISELCSLGMNDVNLYDRTILIYGKGSKERRIQIGNQVVENPIWHKRLLHNFKQSKVKILLFIYKGILCVKIENIMHLRNVCLINLINIIRKSIIRN